MNEVEKQAKQYLESLADPPLPDHLWQRVEGARRLRMRRRRGAVTASAAFVVLAFVLALPGGVPGGEDSPLLAGGPADAVVRPGPGDDTNPIRTVHAIDRALQAAYDRNAGDDEIEPLWRARQAFVHAAAPAVPERRG